MRKPISPAAHGLIDYGFGLFNLVVPRMLGLKGPSRMIPTAWALGQGALNAFTDQAFAIRRDIPFKTHGQLEGVGVPALVVVTLASGAMKGPKAKGFFLMLFAALGTVYMLTDWKAKPQ